MRYYSQGPALRDDISYRGSESRKGGDRNIQRDCGNQFLKPKVQDEQIYGTETSDTTLIPLSPSQIQCFAECE